MPSRISAMTIQRLKPNLRVGVVSVTAHFLLAARLAGRGVVLADGAQRNAIDNVERDWETTEYQNNSEKRPGRKHPIQRQTAENRHHHHSHGEQTDFRDDLEC